VGSEMMQLVKNIKKNPKKTSHIVFFIFFLPYLNLGLFFLYILDNFQIKFIALGLLLFKDNHCVSIFKEFLSQFLG
jgi:hypothetical protein